MKVDATVLRERDVNFDLYTRRSRYPDLHAKYCAAGRCDTRALHDHFKNEGRTMYYGYDKVPVGGIVIFDDVFSHPPVMRAWLDFKSDQGLVEELNRIDRHSSWFRKQKDVKVDKTKKKPPQDINKLG